MTTNGNFIVGWKGYAKGLALLLCLLSAGLLAAPRTWDGDGASALASNPANWVGDVAPGEGDDIILDATSQNNMTWNMTNMTVASWIQSGYLGTVTVATVYGPVGFTNLNITGDCIISNGGWTHAGNGSFEINRLSATIGGNLVIGPNAAIDVKAKGYGTGKGPGTRVDSTSGYGGAYGGCGSKSGPCYGSIVAPTNLGTGGEWYTGGGAIQVTVCGTIRNNGIVCADGNGAATGDRVGSGGSIWLTSGMLIGSGAIHADGGVSWFVPAGGGRVALVVTNEGANFLGFTGTISAYGGSGTVTYGGYGGAGTVHLRTANQGPDDGTLIVDNNNKTTALRTEINSNVTGTAFGDVLIRNKSMLLLFSNQTLTVGGVWSNSASFDSQLISRIIFAGAPLSTSIVYGASTFMELTCTNSGGKTLMFQSGKTNTIPAQGRLMLKGSATTTNMFLRSTSDGTPWKLNVNALADQCVMYVDVKDSDALSGVGAEVTAMNSKERSGNSNWRFISVGIGETNIWTGNGSTVWSFGNNWSLARSPIDDDFILIPSACPQYPVLDNHRAVNGLEIQSGASLSLAGYDLMVRKNAAVAGAITASAAETITFQTNVDFSGGTFTAARSTILLSGSANQLVNLNDQIYYKITVLNSAGTVAFKAGFTATELRCEAVSGMRNLQFQQGAMVCLRDLALLGSITNTNIILRSSSPGQKWRLAVSGYRWSVQGVDVRDSDASFGLPVPAVYSKDGGGNLNWLFNASRAVWLGTSGTNFHVAANWLPAVVPDANTRVLVDSTYPMSITGAVTLLDLTVGGGAEAATITTFAPLTVIENIIVLSNATMALNRPSVVSNGLYVLAGGTLTHSANTTSEANKLDVTVHGSVGVDENGVMDVTSRGYTAGKGPGSRATGAGSYGGFGSGGGPCYGSMLAPTNLGSGGQSSPGGGAILMTVSGEIRNDGVMCADGKSADRVGSAGTIRLTSGTLIGAGIIRANGILPFDGYTPGGGGRIALVVTNEGADFSRFTGPITASSGEGRLTIAYGSGAGTIYKQCASDLSGRGTVSIDNDNCLRRYNTDVPPSPPNVSNEVEFTSFVIANGGVMRLTNDFMVGNIFVQSPNAWLDLGSKTLTVRSREHPIGPGAATNVLNCGTIIWWPDIPKGVVFSTW